MLRRISLMFSRNKKIRIRHSAHIWLRLLGAYRSETECPHYVWEFMEDSGYWMWQCLGCNLCHEVEEKDVMPFMKQMAMMETSHKND